MKKEKKIEIPHLGYTIFYGLAKGEDREILINNNWAMASSKGNKYGSKIFFLKWPTRKEDIPTVAHELIHVFARISKERGIDLAEEDENMAYLMQYCLNEIFEMEYWKK